MGRYMILRSQVESVTEKVFERDKVQDAINHAVNGGSQERLVDAVREEYIDEYGADKCPESIIEHIVALEVRKRGGPKPQECASCGSSNLAERREELATHTSVNLYCEDCNFINDTWRE